jgi:preprotein translocase subunit SecA
MLTLLNHTRRNSVSVKKQPPRPQVPIHAGKQTADSVEFHSTPEPSVLGEPRSIAKPIKSDVAVQLEAPNFGQRLMDWVGSFGNGQFQADLHKINKAEKMARKLQTPEDFQAQTATFKQRLANGESLESMRIEAYTVARQAAVVASGMRPYDCQVMGALAMDDGRIAEMMTGEGKTLTAVMPLYLNALAGKGAHLVTVNDRLAQRDRDDMGPIFELMGVSVGCALETMSREEKRDGYACDVTYTTDRALGFDFLKDRLARSAEQRVQRPLFFALIDEVDEVLLDEARTPLIISGPANPATEDYLVFNEIIEELRPGVEYFVDREKGAAWLSDVGYDFVQNELHKDTLDFSDPHKIADYHSKRGAIRAEGNAWKALHEHRQEKPSLWKRLRGSDWGEQEDKLENAYQVAAQRSDSLGEQYQLFSEQNLHRMAPMNASLRAHTLFEEGVDYLVQDQRVKIVDENKGRTSKGRRYNEGLHQALEAKSHVPIRPESRPIASITYPNFFAKYERLAGMSGTAKVSEGEFQELYDLSVVQVPTNLQFELNAENPTRARKHNRIDETDVMFGTKKQKFQGAVTEAVDAYNEGVPVLLGTLSVEANEYVYSQLMKQGVPASSVQLLNAEHVRGDKTLENSIIAQAGRSGLVTVATNMAGRGVNIKPELINYKKLAMQVEELAAHQGRPLVVDVKDEEQAKRLGEWLEGAYPYRVGEGDPAPGETVIRVNPDKAAPSSAAHLKGEDFPTGGLYVIGTERAKSRRIDDQLIGRSARQGQPGKSRFFLSLEDDLFQDYGGDRLKPVLEVLGSDDGRLESELVETMVGKVQNKVGLEHFHAREDSSAYDKVMNKQRDTFFTIRDSIIASEADLRARLVEDTTDTVVSQLEETLSGRRHSPLKVRQALAKISSELSLPLSYHSDQKIKTKELRKMVTEQVESRLSEAFEQYDLAEATLDEPYRHMLLNAHDDAWSLHLEDMRTLKRGVQWMGVAEKDPEVEFSLRAFDAFGALLGDIQTDSVKGVVPQLMLGADLLKKRAS